MPVLDQLRAVDPVLTDLSLQFNQDPAGFVADYLFPYKQVKGETGTYYIYDPGMNFRIFELSRADGAEARQIDWRLGKATFRCQEYAAFSKVTDRERDNQLAPIELDSDATAFTTNALRLAREYRVRNIVYGATAPASGGNWNINYTSSVAWNNASADPFTDVATAQASILKKVGAQAQDMIVSPNVWFSLRTGQGAGSKIVDRIKYGMVATTSAINENLLAQAFDVKSFKVAYAIAETALFQAVANTSTVALSAGAFIWDYYSTVATMGGGDETNNKVGSVMLVAPNVSVPGVRSMGYGTTFASRMNQVKRYRVETQAADRIETSHVVSEATVVPSAMYLMNVLDPSATAPTYIT